MKGVNTDAPDQYINYILCKEFGWSFKDLYEQPKSFVDEMIAIIGIVNKVKKS